MAARSLHQRFCFAVDWHACAFTKYQPTQPTQQTGEVIWSEVEKTRQIILIFVDDPVVLFYRLLPIFDITENIVTKTILRNDTFFLAAIFFHLSSAYLRHVDLITEDF